MKLTILGSSSATPYLDRHPSSQLLTVNDHTYLIDCGEGTLFRLNSFGVKKNKIKAIFISHLHGDHYYGLIGLLTTMSMHEKTDELTIICPPGLKDIIDLQCKISKTIIRFPVRFIETSMVHQTIFLDVNIHVETIPLIHKIDTCGFIFHKIFPKRKIRKDKIVEHGLSPIEIADLVQNNILVKDNQTITLDTISEENTSKKSFAYCTDTRFDESYINYLYEVDLLYHESTFLQKDLTRAIETKHSTAAEAAHVALKANVKKLLIGHFSARYLDLQPLLSEASAIFSNTDLAIEGLTFEF